MMADSKTRVTRRLSGMGRTAKAATPNVKIERDPDGVSVHVGGRMIFLSLEEARAVSLELVRMLSVLDPER
jgi:hypothetical protein